jgi:ATP-dependent Clp protease adapter protein ClpS
MTTEDHDLSKKCFIVCIDEIQQNFVSGEEFAGCYSRTLTLSDGTKRTIELTATMRAGEPYVELRDSGHVSYMSFNGTTTNGNLMIAIRDLDAMESEAQRRPRWSSPVLPPGTSLTTLAEFAITGFTQGIEILNDNTTPMHFVTSVLSSCLALNAEDAQRMMLEIHTRGGTLIPTHSAADAEAIAARIAAEAAKCGYPLVCRAVRIDTST